VGVPELKAVARRIREAVLTAVEPAHSVRRVLSAAPGGFEVNGRRFLVRGRLVLVAVGKASLAMSRAAVEILGPALASGLVVIPHGYPADGLQGTGLRVLHTGHPVPDLAGVRAAEAVASAAAGLQEPDCLLFLVSGGASALLPSPAPPLTLEDLVQTTRLLLASGASIQELNTVRKHLGRIGGGQLAQSCAGSVVTLAISDVVGDDLSVIGSGPTVSDPSTFGQAQEILERRGLSARVPAAAASRIRDGAAGRVPETPKGLPGRHAAFIVSSSSFAVAAAEREARLRGYPPVVLTTALTGEAREAGRSLALEGLAVRRAGRPVAPPACLIAAGETTVTVTGSGTGGRNQEIALAAARELENEPGILLCSFATDGKEGNSDAAGACASGQTVEAGRRAGLDPEECLARNDSNAFLRAAGELIVTGPTGTNVNDLTLVLVDG